MSSKGQVIGTFDFETDPFKRGREPKPFAGDCFTGDLHTTFWGLDCPEKVVAYLFKHPRIWYAHNGGKFDFHLILPLLPRERIKKVLAINGRIVQVIFEGAEQMELRDSYALIPRPLRDWAKDDIDISRLEAECRDKYKHEIISYLKGDTGHLFDMLSTFIGEYGLHITLASAAFKILHKDFDVPRVRISESMDAAFRPFYFAGRVEFYRLGKCPCPLTCIDINSSFPWSMTQDHWFGEEFLTGGELPKRNLLQSFLRVTADSLGAFPYREEDGGVSFPRDGITREFYITGWEFQAARDLGLLRNCRIVTSHTPILVRSYKAYVEHFYRIKERAESSGNKGERLFAKLLLNSGRPCPRP